MTSAEKHLDYSYGSMNNTSTTSTSRNSNSSSISNIIHHNNNYNIATEPGVCVISAEDGERMRQSYEDNLGIRMTLVVARMIEKAVADGLTVDEIILAIEETGFAPSPSPWYLRKILENWLATGVTISKARHQNTPNGTRIGWWRTRNASLRAANAWQGEEDEEMK